MHILCVTLAVLLTQVMRMLLVLLFHNEYDNGLMFNSDLVIGLDLLLLELGAVADDDFLRFSLLQAILGVLVRAEWVSTDGPVQFHKRADALKVLNSIVHSTNAKTPSIYRVMASEILALMRE